MPGPSSES